MKGIYRFVLIFWILGSHQAMGAPPYSIPPTLPPAIEEVIRTALGYLGTPYKYGGLSAQGLDCSGLVKCAFQPAGLDLPHSSKALSELGQAIAPDSLRQGDLVFFRRGKRPGVGHVGLVVYAEAGACEFIHASVSNGVSISDFSDPHWKKLFVTARRCEAPLSDAGNQIAEKARRTCEIFPLPPLWNTPFYPRSEDLRPPVHAEVRKVMLSTLGYSD